MSYFGLFVSSLIYGLVPFLITASVAALISTAAAWAVGSGWRQTLPLSAAFASVGATTGLFMGASRDSVVGAIVPAFLTVVSGLAVHQFAKRGDISERWRTAIPFGIVAMFTGAVAAASFGAAMRHQSEVQAQKYEEYRLRFERVTLPLELAKVRKDAGLPAAEK